MAKAQPLVTANIVNIRAGLLPSQLREEKTQFYCAWTSSIVPERLESVSWLPKPLIVTGCIRIADPWVSKLMSVQAILVAMIAPTLSVLPVWVYPAPSELQPNLALILSGMKFR